MTQAQYNILEMKKAGSQLIPVFSSMPDELKDCWIHITKLKSLPVKYVAAVYFNSIHPKNTIVVSDFFPLEYPDMYATFNQDSRNERVYINPKYRKMGLLPAFGVVCRSMFYDYLNDIIDLPLDRSIKTEKATSIVKSIWQEKVEHLPVEKRSSISLFDIEPPRDPAYPNIWHEHRIGGKNDQ
jgi:hypothetical protein